jgi:hypothetical protein
MPAPGRADTTSVPSSSANGSASIGSAQSCHSSQCAVSRLASLTAVAEVIARASGRIVKFALREVVRELGAREPVGHSLWLYIGNFYVFTPFLRLFGDHLVDEFC